MALLYFSIVAEFTSKDSGTIKMDSLSTIRLSATAVSLWYFPSRNLQRHFPPRSSNHLRNSIKSPLVNNSVPLRKHRKRTVNSKELAAVNLAFIVHKCCDNSFEKIPNTSMKRLLIQWSLGGKKKS